MMRLGFRLWEEIAMAIIVLAAVAFFGEVLLESTYYPMRDNYRECGRIFLCKPSR